MSDRTSINFTDAKGREYRSGLFVDRAPASGPGWFIYGRCLTDYRPAGIIMVVARPDVPPRRYAKWNGLVRRGWRTQHEARAALAVLHPEA